MFLFGKRYLSIALVRMYRPADDHIVNVAPLVARAAEAHANRLGLVRAPSDPRRLRLSAIRQTRAMTSSAYRSDTHGRMSSTRHAPARVPLHSEPHQLRPMTTVTTLASTCCAHQKTAAHQTRGARTRTHRRVPFVLVRNTTAYNRS